MTDTVRYVNHWPTFTDVVHIFNDGLGSVSVSREDDYNFGLIHDLFVHESVRRQGRGQRLLEKAEWEIVNTYGRYFALLRVVPSSFMEGWYRRNGYEDYDDPYPARGYITLIKNLWTTRQDNS